MPFQVEADLRSSARIEALLTAIQACEQDRDLLLRLLRDLCTHRELHNLANRWAAACLLSQGLSEDRVAVILHLAPTTVNRMDQWVRGDGPFGTGALREIVPRLIGELPPDLKATAPTSG